MPHPVAAHESEGRGGWFFTAMLQASWMCPPSSLPFDGLSLGRVGTVYCAFCRRQPPTDHQTAIHTGHTPNRCLDETQGPCVVSRPRRPGLLLKDAGYRWG
jgi:hypothetical protein